jgi:hypothetical protein
VGSVDDEFGDMLEWELGADAAAKAMLRLLEEHPEAERQYRKIYAELLEQAGASPEEVAAELAGLTREDIAEGARENHHRELIEKYGYPDLTPPSEEEPPPG